MQFARCADYLIVGWGFFACLGNGSRELFVFFSFENIGLQVGAISSSWPCTVLIPKPGAKLLAGAWGFLHPAQGQQLETMLFKDGLEIYFSYFCITHNSITIAAAVLAQEPPIHPPSTHDWNKL